MRKLTASPSRQLLSHHQQNLPSLRWWDQHQPHRGAEPQCLGHSPHLPLPVKRKGFGLTPFGQSCGGQWGRNPMWHIW